MREFWKHAPGFRRYYAVSNKGRVKRIAPGRGQGGGRGIVGRILKLTVTKDGYKVVELCTSGDSWQVYVHVLVALAFIGPKPTSKHEVAHWDGNPGNNTDKNIRWATCKENKADSIRHGTSLKGMRHLLAKVTDAQVKKIKELRKAGWLLREIKDMFYISESRISKICTGIAL